MVIPSLTDPSVAPPGKHVMSCFVQYAPYNLKEGGTWDDHREAFGDTVIDTIAEHAPNIKDIILHRQVLTPLDIERTFGLTEGNIFQGELTLEQLFFLRPAPGWAQYRTPVKSLYMCGSATHPGGGIMGAPGRNAAQRIIKDGKALSSDVIIIGAGHNGLTTAFYLAKAGHKVTDPRRRPVAGGCAATEEFALGLPGAARQCDRSAASVRDPRHGPCDARPVHSSGSQARGALTRRAGTSLLRRHRPYR